MKNPNGAPPPLRVLAVVGSLARESTVGVVMEAMEDPLRERGCEVDRLDFALTPLQLFNPETSYSAPGYSALKERVDRSDVFLLGTPDYHGSMSGVMKNFLDHFWKEFGGKLFASVITSYEKGLTVADQIRTVARQCYAWSMPYSLSVSDRDDSTDAAIRSDALGQRVTMFARDIQVYGKLLTEQRRRDLAGGDPGFMARWRPPKT